MTSPNIDSFINSWRRLGQGRMVLDGNKAVILSDGHPATPWEHITVSGDIFGCPNWGNATDI